MNKLTDREAQYGGVLDAVAKILKAEGLAGFFKGGQQHLYYLTQDLTQRSFALCLWVQKGSYALFFSIHTN